MFDLERQIRDWRQTQAVAVGERPELLDELESHLREETQRLTQSGRPPEEAWLTAVARLGTPGQLAAEFAKLPPAGPFAWIPVRAVVAVFVMLAIGVTWLLFARWSEGRIGLLLVAHVLTVTLGYSSAFAIGTLAVWAILTRANSGWDDRRNEALHAISRWLSALGLGLTAVGVILGGCWASENLGRFWGWDPREIGGLCVLALDAIMLLLLLRPRRRAAMFLGVIANIVVSLAWFGPALIEPILSTKPLQLRAHSYGFAPLYIGWLVVGFVVSQLLVMACAFAPAARRRESAP
jgi:hypothetical protein